MVRLLLKFSLFLPVLGGMAWVNWYADPAMLLEEHRTDPARHRYENVIAQDLLAGQAHRFLGPHSAFIVDELVFRGRPQIDSLAFGSSIGTPIHEGLFDGTSFFNTSMFGARIDEMVAIYQLALDCRLRPRQVLIEIDATTLGRRPATEVSGLLRKARNRLHVPAQTERGALWSEIWQVLFSAGKSSGSAKEHGPFYPYDEVLSPRYFQFTCAFLARKWLSRNESQSEFVDQFGEANQILLYPDGSVEWSDNMLNQTPSTIRLKVEEVDYGSFATEERRPDDDKCRLCEAFVADLLQTGVAVGFVLLPPNPWFYGEAEKEWKRSGKTLPLVDTEAYIRSLAKKYKIPVRGSLNPRVLGVTEEDYVDDVHLRRDSIEKLFKRWKAEG